MPQTKVVELVTGKEAPTSATPTIEARSGGWNGVIVSMVAAVLAGNAAFIWWRVTRADPVDRAFTKAARRARLNRKERLQVRAMTPREHEPVALLISGQAFEAAMGQLDAEAAKSDVVAGLRRKLAAVVDTNA